MNIDLLMGLMFHSFVFKMLLILVWKTDSYFKVPHYHLNVDFCWQILK